MKQAGSTEVDPEDVDAGGDPVAELDPEEGETPNPVESGEGKGEPEGTDGEVQITLGDEESPTPEEADLTKAPEWVRELRKSNREKDRKLREQEQELARYKGGTSQPQAVVVGEKPTLEGCDFDTEAFEKKLEAWHERKREADDLQRKKDEAEEAGKAAWAKVLDGYTKAKQALKVPDFEEAEDVVKEHLSQVQQAIVVNGLPKHAEMVYALGKNPKKLKELAAITDPVKFTVAVAQLEMQLKVTPRKTAPTPERVVRSGVAGAAAVESHGDKTLDKLRDEAAKTGDMSKLMAYKATKKRA